MEELLPCPFCGGKVAPHEITDWAGGNSRYYITCYNNDCEVSPDIGRPSDREEEVIRRWNKRKE